MLHYLRISDEPIDVSEMYKQLVAPEYGGIDMFVGTVRQWTGEIETTKIEYSAYHPMAEKQLEKLQHRLKTRRSRCCRSPDWRIGAY